MAAPLAQMQVIMPLKGFDESGQEGDQSLGTDLIGRFPGQEKGLLDFWPVVGETCLLAAMHHQMAKCDMESSFCSVAEAQMYFAPFHAIIETVSKSFSPSV